MIGASILALVSGFGLGTADFFGGRRTDRHGPAAVLVVTQVTSLVLLAALALIAFRAIPSVATILPAAAAGGAELVGTAAIYRGLSKGRASIVAPAAALAPLLPLAIELAQGSALTALQLAGSAAAILGVVIVAAAPSDDRGAGRGRSGIGWGLFAAAGFGGYLTLIGVASNTGGPVPALLVDRAAAVLILGLTLLIAGQRPGTRSLRHADITAIVGIGVLISISDLAYATATTLGIVAVAAALASTHPVFTVLWARTVQAERMSVVRVLGILLTAAGTALIVIG